MTNEIYHYDFNHQKHCLIQFKIKFSCKTEFDILLIILLPNYNVFILKPLTKRFPTFIV